MRIGCGWVAADGSWWLKKCRSDESEGQEAGGCSRFCTPPPTVLLMLMSVVEDCRVSILQKACKARERVSRREGMVFRKE